MHRLVPIPRSTKTRPSSTKTKMCAPSCSDSAFNQNEAVFNQDKDVCTAVKGFRVQPREICVQQRPRCVHRCVPVARSTKMKPCSTKTAFSDSAFYQNRVQPRRCCVRPRRRFPIPRSTKTAFNQDDVVFDQDQIDVCTDVIRFPVQPRLTRLQQRP